MIDSRLAFDPENDGTLKGAELLAVHKGPWLSVWERFCEAPLTAGTARELADAYGASGWQADDAVLRALECVSSTSVVL